MTKKNKKSRAVEKFEDPVITAIIQGNLKFLQTTINEVGLNFSRDWLGGYVLLCTAVKYNRFQIASWLISMNCTVNRVLENEISDTPLHLAIQKNDDALVSSLLEKGAVLSVKNIKGETPLHISCYKKNINVSKILLEKDNIANIADNTLTTPLHIAVINECISIIQLLLDYEANVNTYTIRKDFIGFSSLHIAVISRNYEIVKLLLDNGADINAPIGVSYTNDFSNEISVDFVDFQDYTPLHLAIKFGFDDLVDLLLEYDPDVNSFLKETNETPLHIAIQNRDKKSVMLLSECNANFHAKTKDGKNVLHLALENDWPELVEVLLLKGADVNQKTFDGETPLFISVEMGDENLVELILQFKANVTTKNSLHQTPLHIAAEFSLEIVTLLLNEGASVDEIDEKGETPLSIAIKHGDYEIIEKLLQCKPNIHISSNKSALVYAIENCRFFDMNIFNLLLEYGFSLRAHDVNVTDILNNAVNQGYIGVLRNLLENGVQLNSDENSLLLHKAISCQDVQMTKLLIQYNCNLNGIDHNGQTAVDYAIEQNNFELLDFLLSSGVKIENAAYSLLMSARDQNILLVQILLRYGIDVNVRDEFGTTALHFATWNRHCRFVKFLLNKKACINTIENVEKNNSESDAYTQEFKRKVLTSPLHISVTRSREICVTLLENHANVNSKDGYGRTALHLASAIKSSEQKNIIKTLLSYGADINIFDNFNNLPLYYIYNPTCVCSIAFQNQYDIYSECECHLFEEDEMDEIANIYIKHIVILSSMGKNVDRGNLNIFMKNEFAEKFHYSCSLEISKIKTEKICGNVTFFDILMRKSNALAAYARNEDIINAFESMDYQEKFPIYCDTLKEQFNSALERDRLLRLADLSLNSLLDVKLPQTVVEYIFDFLLIKDLLNVCEAGEVYFSKNNCRTNSVKRLKVY